MTELKCHSGAEALLIFSFAQHIDMAIRTLCWHSDVQILNNMYILALFGFLANQQNENHINSRTISDYLLLLWDV